jgi:hypothetical protein
MSFGPRVCSTTSPATVTPATIGEPTWVAAPVDKHRRVAEGHRVARVGNELLDRDDVPGGNLVLLAAGLDDCEHRSALVFEPALSAQGCGRRAGFLQLIRRGLKPFAAPA